MVKLNKVKLKVCFDTVRPRSRSTILIAPILLQLLILTPVKFLLLLKCKYGALSKFIF